MMGTHFSGAGEGTCFWPSGGVHPPPFPPPLPMCGCNWEYRHICSSYFLLWFYLNLSPFVFLRQSARLAPWEKEIEGEACWLLPASFLAACTKPDTGLKRNSPLWRMEYVKFCDSLLFFFVKAQTTHNLPKKTLRMGLGIQPRIRG